MGSKRSKASNKAPSSPAPAAPQPDENHQNPKNPNPASPSKPRKKQKHFTSMSPDKSSLSLIPSTEGETPSKNRKHKGKVPDSSNEISLSNGNPNRSVLSRWGGSDILKFLKTIDAFRAKNGFLPSLSHMSDLLREIKDWAPGQLIEKNLHSKIRHLRNKFRNSPVPGPESSEFDRSFYELGSLLWGSSSLKNKRSATDTLNEDTLKEYNMVERKDDGKLKEKASKKLNREKKDVDVDQETENGVKEEDRDSEDGEDGEDSDEKAEKGIEVENGEEHEKDELLVGEDNGLLDGNAAGFPYKYLKLALEEYWMEAKLNMDTLNSALPKVDPVQAKRLDEQFLEVFEEMLKLKIEKNKVSNEIIQASLSR